MKLLHSEYKLFTGKCRNQLRHSSPLRHLVSPVFTPCFTKLVTAAKIMFPWLQSVSKVFTCPAVGAHLWSLTLGCRVRSLIEVCAGGKCCCHQPVDRAAKNGKFHRELGSSYSGARCPTIKYPFWQYPVVRTAVLPMSKSKRKSWHWQENEDTKQEIKCTSFAFGVWLFFSLSMVQIFKLCSVSTKTRSVFYFVPKLGFMAHSTVGNACLEESIQPLHAPVCLWHGLNHKFVVKEVKQDNARTPQDVQINELISLNLIFSSQVYILCKGNPQFSLLSSMPFLPKSLDRLDLSDCSEGCSGLRSRLEVDTSLAIKKESPC